MMNLNCLAFLIQCHVFKIYVEYIMKNHETLPNNPPIHIYINRINNSLLFKAKDGHKLELKTLETVKLLGSTKKLNKQNKEWRKCTRS